MDNFIDYIASYTVSLYHYEDILITMNLLAFILIIYFILGLLFAVFLYFDTKETDISFYILVIILWFSIVSVYIILGIVELFGKLITYIHERRMKK